MSGKRKKGSEKAVPRAYGRLTRHERDTVQRMLERRASCREIARELGRSPSTVSAEVASHRFVTAPKSRRGERVDASADLSAACPRLAAWPRCCNGCGRYRAIGCKRRPHIFYEARAAQLCADSVLVSSRRGIDADEPAAAKACIGYLPELPPLYQEMTVQEYLLFVAELKGTRKKADRAAAVAHAAARAGLQGMEQRLIRNLSKGYRQRVGIAAALLGTPKIIILDEPTVGLDPAQMIEIRSLIRDLGKTHTVILSSHILSEVQTVCDRVLIIAHGRLVAQGTPEELAAQLTAKGTITATAQGSREAVVAAAGKVPGLTDLRVTDEKGGEVSFTAVSTAGTDLRGALSLALAQAGCPVLNLSAETMSLEDVFLQLTETPESGKPESTAAPAENPPAEAAAEEANEKEANSDESNL